MNPDPVSKIQSPDSGNSGELLEQVVERFTQEVRDGNNPDVEQWGSGPFAFVGRVE